MRQAIAVYVMPQCDTCDEAVTDGGWRMVHTQELFCSLVCCKIYYDRPVHVISKLRKEKAS